MRRFLSVLLLVPTFAMAQQTQSPNQQSTTQQEEQSAVSTGIHFTEDLSWEQVKAKAKQENKYIFLDIYTTWCGPCKMMDAQVYPNDSVGGYFNSRFISVKVQMDKTNKDNDWVKSWYNDAAAINTQYKIEGYPTFLFFSPEGKIVHSGIGAITDINKFISLAQTANTPGKVYVDPNEMYYKLVADYKKGQIIYDSLPFMIKRAIRLKDTILRNELLSRHIDYMLTLSPDKRYTKGNIGFWTYYLPLDTKSRLFQLFYRDGRRINKVMDQPYFAEKVVDKVIQKEIAVPFFEEQNKNAAINMQGYYMSGGDLPTFYDDANWNKLEEIVRQQFNQQIAARSVLTARIEWYKRNRNFKALIKYSLTKIEKYCSKKLTTEEAFDINEYAWFTFLYITHKDSTKKAITWAKYALKQHPKIFYLVDTYANLLYKSGERENAIKWEEKAIAIAPQHPVLKYNLELMKKGEKMPGVVWEE